MSNNSGYNKEVKGIGDEQRNRIKDEELWENLKIDFHGVAREFPDNKIYGIIKIKPEQAREIIRTFLLFVNDHHRGKFESNVENISISGFDIKKSEIMKIHIQAISIYEKWKVQQSNTCEFFFNGRIYNLNPVIKFDWFDKNSNPNVIIKWHHIDDKSVEKYTLMLDEKEVHYINQQSLSKELEVCIHHLEPSTKHTIQIVLKLKNKNKTHQSDLIHFTVPEEEDEYNTEVLDVRNESVPSKLLAVIKVEKEIPDSISEADSEPVSEPVQVRDNVLELLEKLRKQIEERKIYLQEKNKTNNYTTSN